jgi:coenzyme F420-reducing hydrogenase alpha subunit
VSGFRPGEVRIAAFLDRGIVRRVAITADRPLSLAATMTGRPVAAVAEAMAALHGLCGQSHAAAVYAAAAAALGAPLARVELARRIVCLAAERLGEHLRSLFLVAGATPDLAALRAAIGIAQRTARGGTLSPQDAVPLAAALDTLGIPAADGGDTPLPSRPVDALTQADDAAVIAALAADTGFIRAPHLPGRRPETGPAARRRLSAAEPEAAQAARLAEIRQAAALLRDPDAAEDWITAGAAGPGTGYAAVESPRGRLYYRLVFTHDRQLADARVLAPTEWNFHPDGPLAQALAGFRPGPDAVAAITRRAAAFDPCVALRISVESAADA